jgi:recombinational DNA repair protein RecT
MEAANAGLYPSKWGGECYVVPYKGVATFIPGYHGMIALAYRVGCRRVWTEIVRQGDFYDEVSGTSPIITHRKAPDDKRGNPIKVYACAELESRSVVFAVLTAAEVAKIKAMSPNGASEHSPWNPAKDPMLHMWRKTAVRQMWPYLPKKNQWAERAERAIAVGDAGEAGAGYSVAIDGTDETVFVETEAEAEAAGQAEADMAGAASEQEQQGLAEAEAAANAAVDPQHGF